MLDPSGMYPKGYHPTQINLRLDFKGRAKRYTRTDRPPRYYLIDFGSSRRYPSRDVTDEPLRGSDTSAPEHNREGWCNPFCTDIYYFGNVVRENFLMVRVTCDLSSAVHEADHDMSSSLLEILWLRVHGGIDQLDDR